MLVIYLLFVVLTEISGVITNSINEILINTLLNEKCFYAIDEIICWDETIIGPMEKIEKHLNSVDCDSPDVCKNSLFGSTEMERNKPNDNTTIPELKRCHLCNINVNIKIQPKLILKDKSVMYVVNTSKYQHILHLKQCTAEQSSSRCNLEDSKFPFGANTTCIQKFSKLAMLVYDERKEELVQHTIQYPSSCECVLRNG